MPKCIIMCAGEFTPLEIEKDETDLVIAADNGLTYLMQTGVLPDLIIGDFDSLSPEGKELLADMEKDGFKETIRLPKEKDDTDTMAAVKEGFKRGYTDFRLYAALGGRLDHTVANIQTLAYILEHGGRGYILDAHQMVFMMKNETRSFAAGFRGTVSLFSYGKRAEGVTLRGMKYPLTDGALTNDFPLGVSNEISGDGPADITVADGTLLAVVSF